MDLNEEENATSLRAFFYNLKPDGTEYEYEKFRRKIRRMEEGNPETIKRMLRGIGAIKPAKKEQNGRDYRSKGSSKFIAYDGEGYLDRYVLLANSEGDYVENPDGLSTQDCLEFLSARYDFPSQRVFYAFGYDVNHIVRDLSDTEIFKLHKNEVINWNGNKLKYIPGKIFSVNGFQYQDTFSWFQRSFVKTVELMLGKEAVTQRLLEGKAARGEFENWTIDQLIQYNAEELELLVRIMNRLRDALLAIDVNLTNWYGPGAIANYWLKSHLIIPDRYEDDVEKALNSAYYGGRFEQISLGTIKHVYEYDIRSAYPSAMAKMPYFSHFTKTDKYVDNPYSIWRVVIDLREWYIEQRERTQVNCFFPLPMRNRAGRICFPLVIRGWYWNDEIRLVLDFFPNAKISFVEGYVATTEGQPFTWVRQLYDYRRSLKASGNLSEYALKVGLNSLYGKTAQRVGKRRFHSLAWAGHITSTTRAKLARAGYEGRYTNPATNASKIIGFATDALFSTEKLSHLPISTDLGEWEETKVATGTFFQSGVYRLSNWGEDHVDRYRGSPLRKGIDDIIEQIKLNPESDPQVRIGRFISNLLAIRAPNTFGPHRLSFIQILYKLQLAASFKRHYHFPGKLVDRENKVLPRWQPNFSELLTDRIFSSPKIWMNDPVYIPQIYDILLDAESLYNDEESYPIVKFEHQLIGEEELAATLEFALSNDIGLLNELPTIEGEVEVVA